MENLTQDKDSYVLELQKEIEALRAELHLVRGKNEELSLELAALKNETKLTTL